MHEHGLGALGIDPGLIATGFETIDAVLERRVVQIGDARLDGVIEPLETQLGFGGALVELCDMFALTPAALLPPVEDGGEDGFQRKTVCPFGRAACPTLSVRGLLG
ncbi:hypothetical protein GTW51_23325 [Aurantimonas aggregata]|uniref:Uncharacterized protein n=1 Tax=Aurantimonas aggregata TaxID=2047720 RepID=A0A6L9MP30_9HYPH|nr:hypothetical protein [Aurantimonas aggregata]NDV89561.1 hypothetical protein [Aurantimonas aggregata]